MKKVFLGLLMSLLAVTANAQFEAGKKYLNASTTGLGLSYSKNEKVRFNIDATAGYFFENDWMVYGRVDYGHQPSIDNVGVGAGVRYYISQNGLYLNLGLQYEHFSQTNANNIYVTPEVGYAFFVNQYITLEPGVYYNMSLNNFSECSKVGLRLGLGFYF